MRVRQLGKQDGGMTGQPLRRTPWLTCAALTRSLLTHDARSACGVRGAAGCGGGLGVRVGDYRDPPASSTTSASPPLSVARPSGLLTGASELVRVYEPAEPLPNPGMPHLPRASLLSALVHMWRSWARR